MRSKTAPTRRLGVENSETRAQLIEAAAKVIRDEGCAAVTARRLAEEVGLKRQIVHYYFGTIEDLLIAVIRRDCDKVHHRIKQALAGEDPLRVIWELGNMVSTTLFEFSAMAIRRKAIQVEMKRYMEEFRRIQIEALTHHLELRGIKSTMPPVATAIVINSISHTLAVERALDVSEGHTETGAVVEEWLRTFALRGNLVAASVSPRSPRSFRRSKTARRKAAAGS
jgi:TetR/AcrR family transcriptional regulator